MAIDDLKESLGIDDDDFQGIKDGVNALDKSTSKFRKGIKGAKSVVKAAKGNIFEFPVFVSSSVPLDYATATTSLLEQVYASYLQMAISANPVITAKSAANGTQFAHLKSDTNKYLECVDTSYQADAAYNRFDLGYTMNGNGQFIEFSLLSIDDGEARIINEQCDYQPLSEFDHFFTEANAPNRTGNNPDYDHDIIDRNDGRTRTTYHADGTRTVEDLPADWVKDPEFNSYAENERLYYQIEQLRRQVEDMDAERRAKATASNANSDVNYDYREAKAKLETLEAEAKRIKRETADPWLDRENRIRQLQEEIAGLDKDIKTAQKERSEDELAKLKAEREMAENKLKDYEADHKAQQDKLKAETDKLNAEIKNMADRYNLDLKKAEREAEKYEYEKSNRRAEDLDRANRGRIRGPQMMDETKIQKLNTMKPLMMTVDLNVEGKDGRIVQGVEYIVGVKCYNRLVDASTLPEVVEYPLKEMNKITRKAKWRAGELKFFKDILFKIPQKKQTAVDSRDPKRKWYRRLYELAHIKGDAPAKAIINGDSIVKAFFKDKLGKYGDTNGVIPNSALIMSKADVDIIKRETKIDMLKGSSAAKFCKELFMIAIIVVDIDSESIKMLMPDLHNDYEVHSIASVNKQLSLLDTSGTKTRDMFKLLG